MKLFRNLIFVCCALAAATSLYAQNDDSLDVAELLVRLSGNITSELYPPAIRSERVATNATVRQEGQWRIYDIEGNDRYHNGKVLNTFSIRLQKWIPQEATLLARDLDAETLNLVTALLNGLYDIADMELNHDKVELHFIAIQNSATETPVAYELEGINRVCEHDDLNSFKIRITRSEEPRGVFYETSLIKPFIHGHIGG